MTWSMTATRWQETETISLPSGSSPSLRWVVHPDPMNIVGVHFHPLSSRYERMMGLGIPFLADRSLPEACSLSARFL